MTGSTQQVHPFPPLYDARSEVLILGSFPSVKSRDCAVFLSSPAKPVLACACRCLSPASSADKGGKNSISAAKPCGLVGCDCPLRNHRFFRSLHPKCGSQRSVPHFAKRTHPQHILQWCHCIPSLPETSAAGHRPCCNPASLYQPRQRQLESGASD